MENTIGKEFVEMTKYRNLEPSPQSQGAPLPPLQTPLPESARLIDLPAGNAFDPGLLDFKSLVENRETLRKYTDSPLSLEELAYLLWGTQGVKSVTEKPVSKRTVPSAGSRHAFETYLLINNVEGLEPGLYRYLALEHKLAKLEAPEDINTILTEACLKQPHVKNSAVTFFWVAVPLRMTWRYCQRGYRYLYLDAGHVCQNLYLACGAVGLGTCAIADYSQRKTDELLGLDGEEEFVTYLAPVGRNPYQ